MMAAALAALAIFKPQEVFQCFRLMRAKLHSNAKGIDAYSPKDMRLAPPGESMQSKTIEKPSTRPKG